MEPIDLNSFVEKLPYDIVFNHILPYSYKKQSHCLCEDIRSFYTSIHKIKEMYIRRHRFLGNNMMAIEWLKQDISRFMNNNIISTYGYTDECQSKYRRHFMLKYSNHSTIRDFVWYISNKCDFSVSIKINIGLLLPKERIFLYQYLQKILNLLTD